MSPERRTRFGVYWKNDALGVTHEAARGLSAHFVKDGKEMRVHDYLTGKDCWWVGWHDSPSLNNPRYEYVVYDGSSQAVAIHCNRLRKDWDIIRHTYILR